MANKNDKDENKTKEYRMDSFHFDDKLPISKEYFAPQCWHAGALFNSAMFVQRNTMTATKKAPGLRTENELDVLERIELAFNGYRNIRLRTLTRNIAKARKKGEYPESDIKRIQLMYKRETLIPPGMWVLGYEKLEPSSSKKTTNTTGHFTRMLPKTLLARSQRRSRAFSRLYQHTMPTRLPSRDVPSFQDTWLREVCARSCSPVGTAR